jgi:K+-transporting ATPase ATPase B chain
VKAGEQIPIDGEVIDGAASVDESAITGESAPVIRESGGDRSAVTGGTTLVSDWLIIKGTTDPGESFLDKMIAMVEGSGTAAQGVGECARDRSSREVHRVRAEGF